MKLQTIIYIAYTTISRNITLEAMSLHVHYYVWYQQNIATAPHYSMLTETYTSSQVLTCKWYHSTSQPSILPIFKIHDAISYDKIQVYLVP